MIGSALLVALLLPTRVPVRCAVPEVEGKPLVDAAWLAERIDQANQIFAPHDFEFVALPPRTLPPAHATMEDRRDRNRLVRLVEKRVVNCFVVTSLRDVDETWRLRQGVHWRPRGVARGKHYVIIAAYAGPTVLAHELGHFFGNHAHSPTPGNIMSYQRGAGLPFFDAAQAKTLRRTLRRFVNSGELVPIKAPPPGPPTPEPATQPPR